MAPPPDEPKPIDKWQKSILPLKFTEGNQVDYLIDGKKTFEAMNDAIETTFYKNDGSYYIYLLGWYCDLKIKLKNNKGLTFDQLLYKACHEFNIQIRVMLWDQLYTDNSQAIVDINYLPTAAGILSNNTQWKWWGAHHQKVLIVKGQQGLIGFCGGVDINEDRVKDNKKTGAPLHDVHCRIQGNGARSLLDVFIQRWLAEEAHVEIDKEPDPVAKFETQWAQQYGSNITLFPSKNKGPLSGINDRKTIPGEKPKGRQYVAIARTYNFVNGSIRCAKEHSIKTSLIGDEKKGSPIGAIAAARRYIYIEDQYLWNEDAARAIGKALPNLQFVIIVISHTDQVKNPVNADGGLWAHYNFMKTIRDNCKEKGDFNKVSTYHRVVPETTELGINTYMHAKCWLFDDELAIIGSANCNRRGWESDSEVAAIIFDEQDPKNKKSFAKALRMSLWSEHLGIPEINLNDWLTTAALWPKIGDKPKKECCVIYYDLIGDKRPGRPALWDQIDPGDGGLTPCGNT